ncbi:TPA: DUF1471 domain-containing protein [Enterobacter hormaechei subsp. xiangfangensis]|nr:DUF1471 domain-containing protein [Enterobacter hormaechei subsp. xiangfangensis]
MAKRYIVAALLLSVSTGVFAAKEIRHSEMAKMATKIGEVTVDIRNGTLDEANQELAKKADEQGAKYYRVTSIGMDGMGSNVSGTAEIYK